MTTAKDAPADTTMMRIVHDALRRDLTRAHAVLTAPARANRDQRRAIGAHLRWMMRFLHAHHVSEDRGVYPLVSERAGADRDARRVLDRMGCSHEAIATAVAEVEVSAAALVAHASDDAEKQVVLALDGVIPRA